MNQFEKKSLKSISRFSSSLLELLECGIPLQKALVAISKMKGDRRIVAAACEICGTLKEGCSLYDSMCFCQEMTFPDWYLSFIQTAEKSGNLLRTMRYIVTALKNQSDAKEKFWGALVYPLFVALFALTGGVFAAQSFSLVVFDPVRLHEYQSLAQKSFWEAAAFLAMGYSVLFFAMSRMLSQNRCILLLDALGFLRTAAVPILESIESCIPLANKSRRLRSVLEKTKQMLLCGEKLSESFCSSFEELGLGKVSALLRSNLVLDEASGSSGGFEKTARLLENRKKKMESAFLAAEQPFLMLITAVFLILILKDTFMPLLGGFGGEV